MSKRLAFAAAFMLLAAVASAQDVSYNFDQKADFTKYKTYKWMTNKEAEQPDALVAKQITDAIDKQLATKGLAKSDGEQADLYVVYQAGVTKEKEVTSWSTGYAAGPGWGGRYYGGYGGGTTTATSATIYIGALAIDFYDVATKQLVWRGLASKQLDMKASPEKRQKNLDKGMAKLLKDYPPKVKK
ncbi:MAG: DUF4136 domain-containing protein [Acidobacteria bacterium]|nr:DUF4136 domain-containing protein [Acidobacteriota bacterium]